LSLGEQERETEAIWAFLLERSDRATAGWRTLTLSHRHRGGNQVSNEALAVAVCLVAAFVGPALGMPWLILVAFFVVGPWLLSRRTKVERLKEKRDAAGLAELAAHGRDPADRKSAVAALGSVGTPGATQTLERALQDPDQEVRQEAAATLGRTGDPSARKAVAHALKDSDLDVRLAAAQAAGELGGKSARKKLTKIAADDQAEDELRVEAAKALGQIGDERAVPALLRSLASRNVSVRLAAANALEDVGWTPEDDACDDDQRALYWIAKREEKKCVGVGAGAVERLIWALDSSGSDMARTQIRNAATWALGDIGDPRAVEPLVGLLAADEDTVRWSAAEALSQLGWQPSQDSSGAAFWAAKGEWVKCVDLGSASLPPLIQILGDTHIYPSSKRGEAAKALGDIGDPRAFEPLVLALDGITFVEAARALGKIGDPRALGPLKARMRTPHLTPSAIQVLNEAVARLTPTSPGAR
jgi:HEAT repeat protein